MTDYQLALWKRRIANLAVALTPVAAVLATLAAMDAISVSVRVWFGVAAGVIVALAAATAKSEWQSAKDLRAEPKEG